MRERVHSRSSQITNALSAVLLILLVVGVGQLSVRPDWHSSYHSFIGDAHHSAPCESEDDPHPGDHEENGCVVDSFAQGGVFFEFPSQLTTDLRDGRSAEFSLLTEEPHAAFHDRGPPGRAPPFFII